MRPGESESWQRHGNANVIGLLETWLEEARKGRIGYAAIVAGEYPAEKSWGFAGIIDLERLALEAYDNLRREIGKCKQNRTLPRRPQTTADHVVYNCAAAPLGWDFLVWLVDAEMTRIREGAPAPLKVRWWFGRDNNTGLRGGSNKQMYENVLKPLLPLIGAVEETEDVLGRHKDVYVLKDITAAAQAGEAVPQLQAGPIAREIVKSWFPKGERPITVTMRECDHWPHRNSNTEAWVRFARDLQMKGERVVFVRDTSKAQDPFYGFLCCPAASVNVDVRMALYERAKCNLLISNGPCGLCLFAPMPYLYFLSLDENDPHPPNKPGFWPKANGVEDGGQLPWAGPHQRLIWKPDTYENLSAAWEEFQPILRKAA